MSLNNSRLPGARIEPSHGLDEILTTFDPTLYAILQRQALHFSVVLLGQIISKPSGCP